MNEKNSLMIKGKLKAYIEGEEVYSGNNLILNDGLDYVAELIGGLTGEGTSFGIESIAVGDDNTAASNTDTDLLGTQLGEGETTNTTPDDYTIRCRTDITNGTGTTDTHYEAVLTNDYDEGIGNRTCLSRLVFSGGIEVQSGQEITYIWEIYIGRTS